MAVVIRIVCTIAALVVCSAWAQAAERVVVRGATLVDVRDGRLVRDATIVVDGDRIVSVAPGGAAPAGAKVIDAAGKYVLPGLIDLHVHYKEWSAELYLNHGVTTVVSLGDTYDWIRGQKAGIEQGTIPGPRLFHSTENLDGTPETLAGYFVRPYVRLVKGAEDARAAMRRYVAERVDAVKVYDGLSAEELRAIAAEAEKANIPVIGHFKDVRVAAEVGAHGVEHLGGVANAIIDARARDQAAARVRRGFQVPSESLMDVARIPEIVALMISKGLYLNPTFRMSWQGDQALRDKKFHYEDFDLTFNDWRLRYIPLAFRLANLKEYQEINLWHWQDLSEYERDLFHKGYLNAQRLVKSFADAGGKLYAGTDSANMAVPGLSLHQELELMVEAGVSPLIALQAATVNPAALMRMAGKLGTVEPGKTGDLVILDANPLEDIRNTRKIWRVISRGQVLDREYHADFRNPLPMNSSEDSSHYFPSPRIRSVTPVTLLEGTGSAVLKVEGTGLIPYSFVCWNGQKLKTEFISEHELHAQVPEALRRGGTYEVTVDNPDFAWGTIFARGATDIAHLGIRGYVSNAVRVTVRRASAAALQP